MTERRALAVVLGCGVAGTGLSWFVAQHSLLGARWKFFLPLAVWAVAWVAGARAGRWIANRRVAVLTILVLAAAMRFAAATGTTPSISNDLYRYGWDARVQLAGVDPYRYPPSAPALRSLRVAPFFPDPAQCAHLHMAAGCTNLNRPSDRTIYPPVAEAWFDAVALVAPGQDARQWQIAGGLVDLGVVGLLMVALSRLGRDPRDAAWYALSPIAVVEFAGNGHVDGLGLLLLLAAILALERGRRALAGALLGLATMVKLYPGIAAVALWRRGGAKMLAAMAAVCAAAYGPHVAAVGARVIGYLPGYLREEHYTSGTRFLLVSMLGLPTVVVTALSAGLFVAAAAWVLRSDPSPAVAVAVLLTSLVLLTSPVQPWYAVALAGVGVLAGAPWLALPALLGELYYAAVILADPHQVAAGRLSYGAALVVIAVAVAVRRVSAGRVTAREPAHGPAAMVPADQGS